MEMFVAVTRHVSPESLDSSDLNKIITCAHIFFSNSKFKDGDDIGFYHELMYKKMVSEFPMNFTHFLDFSDTPTSEFKSTRMLKRHCQQRADRYGIYCDKAYYASYHACGIQDQTISTVKSAITKGKNENLFLKSKEEFVEYIEETLDMHLEGKTVNHRFLYAVNVDDIPRQLKSELPTASGIKKTFFVQTHLSGTFKKRPSGRKRVKLGRHCIFREALCVCQKCFIDRDYESCDNKEQSAILIKHAF